MLKKGLLLLFVLYGSSWLHAQSDLPYQLPPKEIVELADATIPTASFSPDGKYMLILQTPGFPEIKDLAKQVIGIAGLKFNPANNALEEEFSGGHTGIQIEDLSSQNTQSIANLPQKFLAKNIRWNADNTQFAFTNKTPTGVELWVVDVKNHTAKKLIQEKVNAAYGNAFQWHPDGKHILVQTVPQNRGAVPVENDVPTGPVVQENLGTETPSRTYQYLLENKYDEELMDYYLTSDLLEVDLNGNTKKIADPSIFRSFSYAPNGEYILVQKVKHPYSYLVPIYYFPYQTSILSADGKLVKELHESPLADEIPISFDAVPAGPRSYQWKDTEPATLLWVEALDEGNPFQEVENRDALYTLSAPFTGSPKAFFAMKNRFRGINWGKDYAVVEEGMRKNRSQVMTLVNAKDGAKVKEIFNSSAEHRVDSPGRFVRDATAGNHSILFEQSGKDPIVYTIGESSSPKDGVQPFFMRWNLGAAKQDTLFKSSRPHYEIPVFFNGGKQLFVSRESADTPPNFYRINLKNDKEDQLTDFANPYPALKNVKTSLLSYERKDGIPLSGTLYLPEDFKKGDAPLPVLIWAYPREYKSRAAAGEVKVSPYRFPKLAFRSPVFWVTQGYAVLDDAAMPIVGEGDKEPNDTFIEQLIANAEAVIDNLVEMGVGDRDRIAIGGHSYGAFMTANLLAHTDLFAAGIARSGAYNRTLTPFGFQGESRTYWQAPELYYEMSPFSYADKIKTPILLTHGIDDDNSGTFPVQSKRLYSAIKGHGGTVRLVMFPKEFHGYRSRESVLHTFWEQHQWLETYVKNRKK